MCGPDRQQTSKGRHSGGPDHQLEPGANELSPAMTVNGVELANGVGLLPQIPGSRPTAGVLVFYPDDDRRQFYKMCCDASVPATLEQFAAPGKAAEATAIRFYYVTDLTAKAEMESEHLPASTWTNLWLPPPSAPGPGIMDRLLPFMPTLPHGMTWPQWGREIVDRAVERAIQETHDHIRAMKRALEGRLKQEMKTDHPGLSWMIMHAADLLNR